MLRCISVDYRAIHELACNCASSYTSADFQRNRLVPTCSALKQEGAAEPAAPQLPASETCAAPSAALPASASEQGTARREPGCAKQRELAPAGGTEAAAAGRKGGAGKRMPGAPKQKRQALAGSAAAAQPAEGGTCASAPARVPGPQKQGKRAAGQAAEEPARAEEAEPALPDAAARSGGRGQRAGKAAATQRARLLAQATDRASGEGASGRIGGPSGVEEDVEGDVACVRRTRDQGGAREGPADEGTSGRDEEARACLSSNLHYMSNVIEVL